MVGRSSAVHTRCVVRSQVVFKSPEDVVSVRVSVPQLRQQGNQSVPIHQGFWCPFHCVSMCVCVFACISVHITHDAYMWILPTE